ncbi:hypothetical protein PYW07_002689 [Mythimna separata]|uniref:DUF3668 domain-containing protein n=1 Tax=Mythimna separata TaxID=271217 RepID=A0AAD7YGC4_MYTSE|nr:hypothetical protein PYW07_002689 [Mythimna separata]
MDELRGPNIQIILHVKEGLGFGFLRSPFIVSGSLNGYMLETDPAVPSHAPVFDAELVWEADKRRFRSLRVQNVPVKVEVFTTSTQGRKDKVGYLLLSLLGAQPCPSNKIVEVKHSWHRLLGVKSQGKCCHPQLLMSLSIEDRVNTPTPRNELRMFHSNEIAFPPAVSASNMPSAKSMMMTFKEYMLESKKCVSSPDLVPKLLCDEGFIQIGGGKELFVLSFVVGSLENLDLLLPDPSTAQGVDCFVSYSVFTNDIMTDRMSATASNNGGVNVQFNQRTSLRLLSDLASLGRYFAECPHLVTRVCAAEKDVGICSMDLRKLIPTDDTRHFLDSFCNFESALTIHERCFILRCDEAPPQEYNRRAYVDVEMSLRYVGVKTDSNIQSALTIHERCFILRCDEAPPQEYNRRAYVDVEMSLRYVGVKTDSNIQSALTIHERCFILRCDEAPPQEYNRRAYVDVEMSLRYVGVKTDSNIQSALTIHERCFILRCDEAPPQEYNRRAYVDVEMSLRYVGVKTDSNVQSALTIHERCFILRCDEAPPQEYNRRAYVDVEMSLRYVGVKTDSNIQSALTIHERCFILRCDDAPPQEYNRRAYVDVEMSLRYVGVKTDSNIQSALTIHERCFILRCDDAPPQEYNRRAYVDVEMSLRYVGVKTDSNIQSALTIHERCFILRCDEAPPQEYNRRAYVDVEMSLRYVGVKLDSNVQVR